MRIALVSLDQAWEDKVKNRKRVSKDVEIAASAGAELVVFPEMTLTGYSMAVNTIAEDPIQSETVNFFREMALGEIAIAFGVVHSQNVKCSNKLMVVDTEGDVLADYTKIHPFSHAGEQKSFEAGNELVLFRLNGVSIGCTICYDLRFPAVYQALAYDCDLVLNIASWPHSRIDAWDTLLRARAIENQMFMIGVNRTGVDCNGLVYAKSSAVYDPWGQSIRPAITIGTLDIFEIDVSQVSEARRALPLIVDRRNNLYVRLYSSGTKPN
jgi:omega-amidase